MEKDCRRQTKIGSRNRDSTCATATVSCAVAYEIKPIEIQLFGMRKRSDEVRLTKTFRRLDFIINNTCTVAFEFIVICTVPTRSQSY